MTEKELFEQWHNKEYADKLEWDKNKNEYIDYIDEAMWQAWQESANREGYKLVPVDKLNRIIADTTDIDTYADLKAMIGAVE